MTTTIRGTDNSAAAPALTGNDSDTGIYFPAANKLGLVTGGTERVIVDDSGKLGVGTGTPAVALDVVGQVRASTGILFGSDTAAANALDDYEEGTWNPTLSYASGTSGVTYFSQSGRYTKVGRVVHVQLQFQVNNKGTGSGELRISLPFTIVSLRGGLAVGNTQQITLNNSPREFLIEASTSYFIIRFPSGTGSTTDYGNADIGNGFYVVAAGTYEVA